MSSMRTLHRLWGVVGGLAALAGTFCPAAATPEVGFPQDPALSPDGSMIVFVWSGDLWSVPASGGPASRLTAHPADETAPAFSPDGSRVAFESNRDGGRNLFVVDVIPTTAGLLAGQPRRVTTSDRSQSLTGFSADGESLLFSVRQPTLYRHEQMYQAPIEGGPVMPVTSAFGKHARQGVNNDIVFARGFGIEYRPAYRGSGSMDIWRMSGADGSFTQLTEFGGNDMEPYQLPDGSVVFLSSRSGQNNVHRLNPGTTDAQPAAVTQLTRFAPADGEVTIGHGVRDLTVSNDGSTAAFVVWDTLYTLDLRNAQAEPQAVQIGVTADGQLSETERIDVSRQATEVALHPSGEAIAMVARGELWVRSTKEDRPTRRITQSHAREQNIAWSPDGRVLYFAVDDEQSLGSIYAASVTLSLEDIAPPKPVEKDEPAEEPVAEPAGDPPSDPPADPAADPAGEPATEPAAGDQKAGDENGDSKEKKEDDKESKPDYGKRWAESITFTVEPVVTGATWDRTPMPSPDGKFLLLVRSRGDLILRDLQSGTERVLFNSWNEPEVLWASDSRHIVYAVQDLDFNSDIFLMDTALDAEGKLREAVNLTRHPDNDISPRLSHDGKVLTFLSDRDDNNWDWDVYAIYLDRELESMRSYDLAAYFEEAAKSVKKLKPLEPTEVKAVDAEKVDDAAPDEQAAKKDDTSEAKAAKPLEFDADDAYRRVRRITSLPGSEADLMITPAGDRILFEADVDGSRGYYSVDYKGSDRKQVSSSSVSGVSMSLTGDQVVYLDGGVAKTTPPAGGKTTTYSINAVVHVTIAEQQRQKFLEGARTFGEYFYHPTIKGLDWAAIVARYATLAERTRTSAEFNGVFTMLLGEVDSSHVGIGGGGGFSERSPSTGYLGVDATPVDNGWRVDRVLDGGPGDMGPRGLEVGDVIVAVNAEPLRADGITVDLDAALVGASGQETLLEIRRSGAEGGDPAQRYVLLTPHSSGAETNLRYDDGVRTRREQVEKLSEGRLGYLHIRGMSMPSVRDFERDLFAAANGKEGLVIDVRDNGGGSTADILLASLTAPAHAYTIPRGANPETVAKDAYPRDRRLIYGWTRPINVLINQNSFSNAEIFAHAIKTIDRGKLVGTPTFGGVISTGSFSLIDGTTIRRPFRGWYTPDGRDMDVFGAVPDVRVDQVPADEVAGRDRQLEAAVEELLGRVGQE